MKIIHIYIYISLQLQLRDSIQFDDPIQVDDSIQFDNSIQVGSDNPIRGPFGPMLSSATWRTRGDLKGGATRLELNPRL